MKNTIFGAPRLLGAGLLTPSLILLATGTIFGLAQRSAAPLGASSGDLSDTDGDGLVYGQERILETDPSLADSDGDGYLDSEEFARGSSPLSDASLPQDNRLGIGLTARGEPDGLHALAAIYLPDHDYRSVNLEIGLLVGRRLVTLRHSLVTTLASLRFVPAGDPLGLVALVDLSFPRSWVEHTGHLTIFATVSRIGEGTVADADAINLTSSGGVILLAIPSSFFDPAPGGRTALNMGGGSIFKPLTAGDYELPEGWVLGEACSQTSQVVAVSGSVIVSEIVSAECTDGWDGACPPDCSSSVGSTYTTVDPARLVGG